MPGCKGPVAREASPSGRDCREAEREAEPAGHVRGSPGHAQCGSRKRRRRGACGETSGEPWVMVVMMKQWSRETSGQHRRGPPQCDVLCVMRLPHRKEGS